MKGGTQKASIVKKAVTTIQEPVIKKTAKQIKAEVKESEVAVINASPTREDAVALIPNHEKGTNMTAKAIPLTNKQSKARAANKRGKKARKISHK